MWVFITNKMDGNQRSKPTNSVIKEASDSSFNKCARVKYSFQGAISKEVVISLTKFQIL